MIFDPTYPLWPATAFCLGACIGSFLNVVIYRLPLGLSINEPKRSFCPHCRKPIPGYHNVPLISWLMLRGKCANCSSSIPFRYPLVELVTALLFLAAWLLLPPLAALIIFVFFALLVAITWIDADHMIIPVGLTTGGSIFAVLASLLCSSNLYLSTEVAPEVAWWKAPLDSLLGWVLGFFLLWSVVLLGKMALGKKRISFEEPTDWHLEDGNDDNPVTLHLDGEIIPWHDLFYRKSDELILQCDLLNLNGETCSAGVLRIREEEITLPDGTIHHIEKVHAISGKATNAILPREVMGMGDPHLLGMIGAFLGGSAVIFTVAFSAFYAIGAALLGRIGFGKQLPYGPFLALGAVTWVLGGWKLWHWYMTTYVSSF